MGREKGNSRTLDTFDKKLMAITLILNVDRDYTVVTTCYRSNASLCDKSACHKLEKIDKHLFAVI